MKINSLKQYFIVVLLFFLPFHYALTINVGFQLKISEIALVFLILLNLKTIYCFFLNMNLGEKLFVLFVFWTILSFIINQFNHVEINIPIRYSYFFDSLSKLVYLIGMFLSYIIFKNHFKDKDSSLKFEVFYWGLVVACIYSWYLAILSIQNMEPFLLPGMDKFPQHTLFSVGHYIRCGTFKEGNHFALLLLIGTFKAYFDRKWGFIILFAITILLTVSTIAVLCLVSFVIFILIYFCINKKFYLLLVGLVITFSISVYLVKDQKDVNLLITQKIIPKENIDYSKDWGSFSRIQRLNYIKIAYQIACDNPLFGVGIANYGLYFDQYNKFEENKILKIIPYKRITNNVYFEILAEQGFVGIIIFLSILIIILNKINNPILKCQFVLVCVYLSTYPSYTLIFLYYFVAYIITYQNERNNKKQLG